MDDRIDVSFNGSEIQTEFPMPTKRMTRDTSGNYWLNQKSIREQIAEATARICSMQLGMTKEELFERCKTDKICNSDCEEIFDWLWEREKSLIDG
jgi:hypothetical protein